MCSVGSQRFFMRNGSWAVTLTAEGLSVARPSALSVSWARLPPDKRKLRGDELENASFEVAPPLSVPKQQQPFFILLSAVGWTDMRVPNTQVWVPAVPVVLPKLYEGTTTTDVLGCFSFVAVFIFDQSSTEIARQKQARPSVI